MPYIAIAEAILAANGLVSLEIRWSAWKSVIRRPIADSENAITAQAKFNV